MDQVSNEMGSWLGLGRGRRETAGGLALLMKEPQSVTRLYFSCLRVFHGVASSGRREGGTGTSLILRKRRGAWCSKEWLLESLQIQRTSKTYVRVDFEFLQYLCLLHDKQPIPRYHHINIMPIPVYLFAVGQWSALIVTSSTGQATYSSYRRHS